jgi:hypothetical protein
MSNDRQEPGGYWGNPFQWILLVLLGVFALLFSGVVFVAVCTAVQGMGG